MKPKGKKPVLQTVFLFKHKNTGESYSSLAKLKLILIYKHFKNFIYGFLYKLSKLINTVVKHGYYKDKLASISYNCCFHTFTNNTILKLIASLLPPTQCGILLNNIYSHHTFQRTFSMFYKCINF